MEMVFIGVSQTKLATKVNKVSRKHKDAIKGIKEILAFNMHESLKLQLVANLINKYQAEINEIISKD